jgi:hypothetical protein
MIAAIDKYSNLKYHDFFEYAWQSWECQLLDVQGKQKEIIKEYPDIWKGYTFKRRVGLFLHAYVPPLWKIYKRIMNKMN